MLCVLDEHWSIYICSHGISTAFGAYTCVFGKVSNTSITLYTTTPSGAPTCKLCERYFWHQHLCPVLRLPPSSAVTAQPDLTLSSSSLGQSHFPSYPTRLRHRTSQRTSDIIAPMASDSYRPRLCSTLIARSSVILSLPNMTDLGRTLKSHLSVTIEKTLIVNFTDDQLLLNGHRTGREGSPF